MIIRMINSGDDAFEGFFEEILKRGSEDSSDAEKAVAEIISRVKKEGDRALIEYTSLYDGLDLTAGSLRIPEDEIERAYESIEPAAREALTIAEERIRSFHSKQASKLEKTWTSEDEDGIVLGQIVRPLDKVGIYVPGGKASYPSSVLMNAVPARVAGVGSVAMVVPTPGGKPNPYLLAAAKIAGVDSVYRVGGAQAVAALAYGTQTIPRVDKIVGPGNIYVATAKKMVFGDVDIDMVAGPSEVLIISDGSGEATHIAADMLAQAEHDEMATSILITTSDRFADRVAGELSSQLKRLSRYDIARASIEKRGAIIVTPTLDEAFGLANRIAPEHLELAIEEPFAHLDNVKNAGAVFLGHYTPEAIGDYIAGPNHVLPTGGSARFFSPLGTYDFIKRSSVVSFSRDALGRIGRLAEKIADIEGLEAHGNTIRMRMERDSA